MAGEINGKGCNRLARVVLKSLKLRYVYTYLANMVLDVVKIEMKIS